MSRILTVRTVESIKPGPGRQELANRHLPGLYLIVQPSGARSWAVRYRHGGQTRKHTLGAYPALDLKAARDLAREALRSLAEGRDPEREKAQARTVQPDTVEAVVSLFIERHVRRVNRPSTAVETQRLLNRHACRAGGIDCCGTLPVAISSICSMSSSRPGPRSPPTARSPPCGKCATGRAIARSSSNRRAPA